MTKSSSCLRSRNALKLLEPALRDLGNGNAVNMPRQDLLVPGPLDGSYHGLKTSCASLPRSGVTTMRLTSDILTWPVIGGRQRRVKVPLAMGGKYVGLVFVFSTATGELLGHLSRRFYPGDSGRGYQRALGEIHGPARFLCPGGLWFWLASAAGSARHVQGFACPRSSNL